MERARELSRPYMNREGVVGIYVVGSATRPHRDDLSDYDIEVVLEDPAYARTPDAERQVFVYKDSEPKVVDYEFYLRPWSEFLALVSSTQDLFHYPYQHAVILHDPDGRIASIVRRLAELPEEIVKIPLGLGPRLQAEHVPQVTCAPQPEGFQVALTDDLAVEEVAGENKPTEECVQYCGIDASGGCSDKRLTSRLEAVEQVPIHAVRRIERPLMPAEELA